MAEDKTEVRSLKNTRIMDSVSGTNVQVIFEFPSNDIQKSLYIYMPDMITVSHSVSRAKIPVTLLGETTVSGLGLGTKMVAGSIVKLVTREDSITGYIKKFVDDRFDKLTAARKVSITTLVNNLSSYNEISDYMRDDIAPFNIHLVTTSEFIEGDQHLPKIDSIFGCTIINTGKVSSIENLISEETISFMAKYVKYDDDLNKTVKVTPSGYHNANSLQSGSDLLYKLNKYARDNKL